MTSWEFDHTDPSMAEGIYDWIAARRSECPVIHTSKLGGFWAALSFREVIIAAHDAERFSSAGEVDIPNIGTAVKSYPLQADPPEHGKYRRVLQPFFTQAAVANFAPAIRRVVVEHVDSIASNGRAEIVSELAKPIPAISIALILGIGRSRWEYLQEWSSVMLDATIAKDVDRAKTAGKELFEFIVDEVEARKAVPRDDLLTAITQARIDGQPIDDELRWGMAQLLMIAGHETTVNATANLIHHLATRPALRKGVATDGSVRSRVVTESLRYESPVFGLARTVLGETYLGPAALSKGDRVLVCFGAANRDPARFDNPDTFDPDRTSNSHHVAFGYGRHRCIGEHLARLELEIIIEEWLRKVPDYRLREGAALDVKMATVRGPRRLEVVWDIP